MTKKLLQMHRDGAGLREMGRELGVQHQTVKKWLEEMGLLTTSTGSEAAAPASPRVAAVVAASELAEGEAIPAPFPAPTPRAL